MTNIASRFITAAAGKPPQEQQLAALGELRDRTIALAEAIDSLVPEGRDKSLAFTHLEDVLMRANRGVFSVPQD